MEQALQISEKEFLQHYLQNAKHLMWFLGAGASRSAGLRTATDIIWDLKLRYYCRYENQDLQSHDISNKSIKKKIQAYMDSKGYPALWSPEEYSFYFHLTFNDDYSAQQQYINEVLGSDKVSLNFGHRAIAALLEMGQARIIFTTNFDNVIETAYAEVSGKNLSTFHIEGSYAALDALNREQFPLYCKVHGDFRYQSIKNLAEDLRNNDKEIQKCFLAAATRYGLVVSGYSGRDENVMYMFREAINQQNAFPHGLFWMVYRLSEVTESVRSLIEYAQQQGVRAYLCETGPFDDMLSKIWRQVQGKPQSLDEKVRIARVSRVSIPLPAPGKNYPILRTNALPVITPPNRCGTVEFQGEMTFSELKKIKIEKSPKAILTYTDRLLFWGEEEEVAEIFSREKIVSIQHFEFENIRDVGISPILKSFLEEALAKAICSGKPLFHRRSKDKTHYAVVRDDAAKDAVFENLRKALMFNDQPIPIAGKVPGLIDVTWAEAVSIRLEERGGRLWVMLKPDIWIKPLAKRQEAREFLDKQRKNRFNKKSHDLLNAWIRLLLGDVGLGSPVKVSCFPKSNFDAVFEIGIRTAFSRGGNNGN